MMPGRIQEFIVLLLIENKCEKDNEFNIYLKEYYDTDKINTRYMELLDDFLKEYALNKTEKSD